MLDDLARLVEAESPTDDPAAVAACADRVAELGGELLAAAPERVAVEERPHLRWSLGAEGDGAVTVALLAHLDTVWPVGTIDRWPFAVDGGRATGPGTLDMKAGIVQGLHALAALREIGGLPTGVELLVTSDEEIGSPTSRGLVESTARAVDAVLVLEPSAAGALKVARKGVSRYRLVVSGRAAHAGLEPERGVNALEEAAEQVRRLRGVADPAAGTTVTPTLATAGSAVNVVPASAVLEVDVRAASVAEQERVHAELRAARATVRGATIAVEGGVNRPPLERSASTALHARACEVAARLGIDLPPGVEVGGGSDGNLAAATGAPTLDGLGGVGEGVHAEGEHVEVAALVERAALLAGLLIDLAARPLD